MSAASAYDARRAGDNSRRDDRLGTGGFGRVGLGCSMMQTMASAYAVVRSDQVPGATSVLNTLQRLGGSIGTAVLAVVLSDQARSALGSGAGNGALIQTLSPTVRAQVAAPLARGFGTTFLWALGATLIALIPAAVLVVSQRRERQATGVRARRPTGPLTSVADP